MANINRPKYEIELLTPEQRVQKDPRAREKMTRISESIFRKVIKPAPEIIAVEEVNNNG
jgi:hypothetical protein